MHFHGPAKELAVSFFSCDSYDVPSLAESHWKCITSARYSCSKFRIQKCKEAPRTFSSAGGRVRLHGAPAIPEAPHSDRAVSQGCQLRSTGPAGTREDGCYVWFSLWCAPDPSSQTRTGALQPSPHLHPHKPPARSPGTHSCQPTHQEVNFPNNSPNSTGSLSPSLQCPATPRIQMNSPVNAKDTWRRNCREQNCKWWKALPPTPSSSQGSIVNTQCKYNIKVSDYVSSVSSYWNMFRGQLSESVVPYHGARELLGDLRDWPCPPLQVPFSGNPQRVLPGGCTALESRAGCSNDAGAPSQSGAHPGRPAVDSSQCGHPLRWQATGPRPLCKEKQQHRLENATLQTDITHFLSLAHQWAMHCSSSKALNWA